MKWQSGSRLNQYRIDRVLATGGFGITYQATHLGLGQQVVIKTINDNLRRDPEYNKYLKQFRKEAQTLARLGVLHHPHIVRVSDLFDAPLGGMQVPCLVMDFINGENLFTRIRNTKSPLSEPEALKYIQQVGDALHLVHRSGLVHRDVHPGNIMIYKNKAILIDFGLAGSVTPSILSSQRGGNPAYAPHDQWRGNRAPNLDIYSLGMCLYFALTAETPDPFTAPQIKNPTISDRTNAAIVKAIHLDRKNRPQSIRAWFDLLDLPLSPEALQSLPIPAKPKPQPPAALPAPAPIKEPERENPAREPRTPQKSKPQKRKGMAVIAGLICLVLIGIMAALVRRNTLPPPPPPPTPSVSSLPSISPDTSPDAPGISPSPESPSPDVTESLTPPDLDSLDSFPLAPLDPNQTQPGDLGIVEVPPNPVPQPQKEPQPQKPVSQPPSSSSNSPVTAPGVTTPPVPVVPVIPARPEPGVTTPPTFLGFPVRSFSFTTARVSANGSVSPSAKQGKIYVEQALNSRLDTGELPLEMVTIPRGTFMMGSPASEAGRDGDEGPQRSVTVGDFLMGRYEITQAQWFAVMGGNPSAVKGENLPVTNVSWDDAKEFVRRLRELTGKNYRLPTEAEWEYAARAGTCPSSAQCLPFSYGETITPEVVNYDGRYPYGNAPTGRYRGGTIDVNTLYPNPWGLYHIHGNVWEWVEDGWHDSYNDAPRDGTAWLSSNELRVLRGGSWIDGARDTRSANRVRDLRDSWDNNNGFRVVLVP